MARARPTTRKETGQTADAAEAPASRPTSLDVLIGQERAVGLLREAVRSGRLHHAWIFHGPAGVGKFTGALAFGAELLTPPRGSESAGMVKELLQSGRHPDLHVVRKELASISRAPEIRKLKQSNIAREVLEEFFLEPASRSALLAGGSAAGKVFIIEDAEFLDPRGQNTLLKTLEEPHPGTIIILVTSDENALLPTVRSRCQRVAFVPLSPAAMDKWLASAGIAAAGPERQWLVLFAAGAPGVLKAAAAGGLFEWQKVLEPLLQSVDRGAGAAGLGSTMAKLVDERAAAQAKANPNASKEQANRHWAGVMFGLLIERYRRRLGAPGPACERTLAAMEAILEAEAHVDSNVAFGAALENLAAQLQEVHSPAAAGQPAR